MPLQYKIDVLAALKEKGYNTNKIRTEGLLSQSTLQKFRNKQGVSWENLEMLCCSPRNRLVHKHVVALQLGNLAECFYLIKIALKFKILQLGLCC